MKRVIFGMVLGSLLGFACSDGSYFLFHKIGSAEEAVLGMYLEVYCHPLHKVDVQQQAGAAAVLSKLVVQLGIGNRALVEYGKCAAGWSVK